MSAALTDREISYVGTSILSTHVRPSESHTSVNKEKEKNTNPANRSDRVLR